MVGLKHWHAASGFMDTLQGIFEPEALLTLKMGTRYFSRMQQNKALVGILPLSTGSPGSAYKTFPVARNRVKEGGDLHG